MDRHVCLKCKTCDEPCLNRDDTVFVYARRHHNKRVEGIMIVFLPCSSLACSGLSQTRSLMPGVPSEVWPATRAS